MPPAAVGAAALATFVAWGLLPLFYRWFSAVPAWEVMAHRVVWSLVVCLAAIAVTGRWRDLAVVLTNRRKLRLLALAAATLSINWVLFIWAIGRGHVLESSMGYFIYPLVTVMLGFAVLRERLRPREWVAVALVAAGVGWLAVGLGSVPWVALGIALSFGLYGLLRKIAPADAVVGLTVETLVLAPLAGLYLVWLQGSGVAAFAGDGTMRLMLVLSGPATALPLFAFAFSAKRLRLATLGLMQYLNPCIQVMLAVWLWHEPFGAAHAVGFGLIWLGLVAYSLEALRFARRPLVAPSPP